MNTTALRVSRLASLVLLLLCWTWPASARPQVLVIIADGLTLRDVLRPDLPAIVRMREGGQLCLMSAGLATGPAPIANVYATLGAGDAITTGNKSQGLLGRALTAAGVRTALIGNADGDDTGASRPAALLLPVPTLAPADDGTQPDPAAPGGRRINPPRLWQAAHEALRAYPLVIVQDGDFARLERERPAMLPRAYDAHRRRALARLDALLAPALRWADAQPERYLWLLVPTPPVTAGQWDSLTPFMRYGTASSHAVTSFHTSAQSATTQTWGLVAARDIAPSLVTIWGLTPPLQMTGAPITGSSNMSYAETRLRRLDTLTRLNQQAQSPFFWTLGLLGALVIGASMALLLRAGAGTPRPFAPRAARYGLRVLSGMPLALLLAPLLPVSTVGTYCGVITLLALGFALMPTPQSILAVTTVVLLADGLTGTRLISHALLSAYALSGIRFYGIGNEYMGVLIAGTLLLASGFAPPSRVRLMVLFTLVIFVLSFPEFGAKAGGAVTATATFVIAWRRLRGLPLRAAHIAGSIAAGFALVLLWAALGHWLPLRRTHMETAADALGSGRFGYIAGVAWRKVGLALRVALHPGTLAGLGGMALLGAVARAALRAPVTAYLAQRPRFAAVCQAGLWGSAVCVVFNDSGIVAAILLLLCLALPLLHGMLHERVT